MHILGIKTIGKGGGFSWFVQEEGKEKEKRVKEREERKP